MLPLVVVIHLTCGHVILHGREALRSALFAERHDLVFVGIRVGAEGEHVLGAAEWQAARTIEFMVHVLRSVKVTRHVESRLAK